MLRVASCRQLSGRPVLHGAQPGQRAAQPHVARVALAGPQLPRPGDDAGAIGLLDRQLGDSENQADCSPCRDGEDADAAVASASATKLAGWPPGATPNRMIWASRPDGAQV
jgi:hypothetical protein